MKIDCLILGPYKTNCYVLRSSKHSTDCLIIDTGLEPEPLIDFLQTNSLAPVAVVLTHGHVDHIAGLPLLRQEFPNAKVHVHKLDAEMFTAPDKNLSALAGAFCIFDPPDYLLEQGSIIDRAGISFNVLHTPGHTPGSISLYAPDQNLIFVGDTLFAGSVGRTDFPSGSTAQLIQSINEKLLVLPGRTIVYPGHGPATTIQQEKTHNPFLR